MQAVVVVVGSIKKSGNWWAVEMPDIGGHTQGRTKQDALRMAADLVRCRVNDAGMPVFAKWVGPHNFELALPPTPAVMTLMQDVVRGKFVQ